MAGTADNAYKFMPYRLALLIPDGDTFANRTLIRPVGPRGKVTDNGDFGRIRTIVIVERAPLDNLNTHCFKVAHRYERPVRLRPMQPILLEVRSRTSLDCETPLVIDAAEWNRVRNSSHLHARHPSYAANDFVKKGSLLRWFGVARLAI